MDSFGRSTDPGARVQVGDEGKKKWTGIVVEKRFNQITVVDDKTKDKFVLVQDEHRILAILPKSVNAIRSESIDDMMYIVRTYATLPPTCSCPGFLVWNHCKHLGGKKGKS